MGEEELFADADEGTLWEFPAPAFGGLLDIGEKLFIYESGVRIGLGRVLGQNDSKMLVKIEFTVAPRLNVLYYGTLREAAGLEEAN